jgi:hypothetical protein
MLEISRGADVPRIRYDEAAALVERAERLATIDHGDSPVRLMRLAFLRKTGQRRDL